MAWTAQTQPRIEDLIVLFLLFGFDEPAPQPKAPKAATKQGKVR